MCDCVWGCAPNCKRSLKPREGVESTKVGVIGWMLEPGISVTVKCS